MFSVKQPQLDITGLSGTFLVDYVYITIPTKQNVLMNNKSVFKTDKTVCLSVCLPIYPSINLNKIKSRIMSLCNFHWQCFTKSQKVYVNFWKVFWNAIVGNDFVLLSCMANKSSIGPPSYGGLYKITAVSLSLCPFLSLSPLVWHFSEEWLIVFVWLVVWW